MNSKSFDEAQIAEAQAKIDVEIELLKAECKPLAKKDCHHCFGRGWYSYYPPGSPIGMAHPCVCVTKEHDRRVLERKHCEESAPIIERKDR